MMLPSGLGIHKAKSTFRTGESSFAFQCLVCLLCPYCSQRWSFLLLKPSQSTRFSPSTCFAFSFQQLLRNFLDPSVLQARHLTRSEQKVGECMVVLQVLWFTELILNRIKLRGSFSSPDSHCSSHSQAFRLPVFHCYTLALRNLSLTISVTPEEAVLSWLPLERWQMITHLGNPGESQEETSWWGWGLEKAFGMAAIHKHIKGANGFYQEAIKL